MELTASEELLAMENIDVLKQNGFEVDVVHEGECGQGSRLKLTAQPISKSTVFDMKGSLCRCARFSWFELNILTYRSTGTHTSAEGLPGGSDGQMFEGEGDVCNEGLQKECHGRDALESATDVVGECRGRP
jgi:hypothetical protein